MERSAIVTGGTGGLGSAVVARLLDDGWRVVVPWIVEGELERVPRARRARARTGRPVRSGRGGGRGVAGGRGFVRGAAAGRRQPGRRVRHGRPGARDPDRGVRAAVPPESAADVPGHLGRRPAHAFGGRRVDAGGGSIVCVGTRAAVQPFSGAAGYIASKAAVIAFAQAVAAEYKNDGIRCNAILPSVIDTPGQPRIDAKGRLREVGQAGGDRRRDRPLLSTTHGRPAALRCRSTGAPDLAHRACRRVRSARKSRRRAALL